MDVRGREHGGENAGRIHPQAQVDPAAVVGPGASIGAQAKIGPQATIGCECRIGARTHVAANASIGDRGKLEDFVRVARGVAISRDAVVGWGTSFANGQTPADSTVIVDDLPADQTQGRLVLSGAASAAINVKQSLSADKADDSGVLTVVEEGALIAPGCVVGKGVRIGRYAMVGAGSVILESVPDYHWVAGRPARSVGAVCRCGWMLARFPVIRVTRLSCPNCCRTYELHDQTVRELTLAGSDASEPLFRDDTLLLVGKCPPL